MVRKETLTSRERVIRMLKHEPVDRVPIDLGSHASTGISAIAYWKLRESLGLSTDDIWIPDTVQFLAYVDEEIRKLLHVDCIFLEPRWEEEMVWNPRDHYRFKVPKAMNPVRNEDGDWIVTKGSDRMRMPRSGYFFDGSWLSNWASGDDGHSLSLYAREAERLHNETGYALNFTGYGRGWSFGAFFGGFDRLVRMMLEPEKVMEENDALCDHYIERAGRILDTMGGYLQLISICDDMGTQSAPMCRPSVVEQCVMPYIRRFCDFIHRNSDIKVFMHNCGSIYPYIPMLIDAGVDALNPVQISAAGMEPEVLARDFGGKITFWGGGCDTQNVLGTSDPEGVRANVRHLLGIFKETRGVVFNPVHNIMGDVPPENILAMFETAYEEAFYGETEKES